MIFLLSLVIGVIAGTILQMFWMNRYPVDSNRWVIPWFASVSAVALTWGGLILLMKAGT